MSNNATESQGQEPGQSGTPEGQESGGGAGQGQEPGQQGNQQGPEGVDLSTIQDPAVKAYLEKIQKDAEEARREAARYRTERNTFQQQAQEYQRQNETDQERQQREAQEAKERLEQLERENRDLKVGTALQQAAEKAKAFNPATVAGLLNARVQLDDKGTPTNLQDLLTELRQSDPYLFRRTNADAGEGNEGEGNAPAGGMNDFIRGQVAARRGRTS